MLAGCTWRAGKPSGSFFNGAYQGSDFLSFQGNSWQPSPGAGSRAQKVCAVLNRYRDIKEIVLSLLSHTCPRFLAGILEAGKSELGRQGEHPQGLELPMGPCTLYRPFETYDKRRESGLCGFQVVSQMREGSDQSTCYDH